MNYQVWSQALKGIMRLDRDEWNKLDYFAKWLVSTRAAVLVMTFI